MPNIWYAVLSVACKHRVLTVYRAMTHDEVGIRHFGAMMNSLVSQKVYSDPLKFRPERFLKPDGQVNDDQCSITYGFGRRSVRSLQLCEMLFIRF